MEIFTAKKILLISFILISLLALDRFFLWCEKKGWIYYRRHEKKGKSGAGHALQSLDAFFMPSVRHCIQVKEQLKEQKQDAEKSGGTPT